MAAADNRDFNLRLVSSTHNTIYKKIILCRRFYYFEKLK
ncbi:hypothetical protein TREVI0001_2356 [Treponema vincentii ATCC 35580]|uniref:Uncharacterized protein n=1 Tax=Treponema vincentii ATCC 35580 TaxID=596324 RepID=C8PQY1_9SPIR|nr:hypothetical protein TREVI0001_2356 [Treponema vincentii ATCC 35580]